MTDLHRPSKGTDWTLANLSACMHRLSTRVDRLEIESSTLQAAARLALQSGRKSLALMKLRNRHRLDSSISTLHVQIDQLHAVRHALHTAFDQRQIVQCMQQANSALQKERQLNSVDDAAQVMAQLSQELANVQINDQQLAQTLTNADEAESEELNQELAKMQEAMELERHREETRSKQQSCSQAQSLQSQAIATATADSSSADRDASVASKHTTAMIRAPQSQTSQQSSLELA